MSEERKVAIVTGAVRGIGKAIALQLAGDGFAVAVNYRGDQSLADEVCNEISANGGEALAVKADVTDAEDVAAMVEAVMNHWGRIDALINNAGITRDTLLMRMDEAAWDDVLDTNLKSVFATCRAATRPMMKARAGVIINVSSISGIMGNAGQTNYAASKAGMIGFSKSLARELAPRGIRVNVVAPGFINSDMTSALDEKIREAVVNEIPLKRFGDPADIANAVTYLASPLARFVTGAVLVVDGGMSM